MEEKEEKIRVHPYLQTKRGAHHVSEIIHNYTHVTITVPKTAAKKKGGDWAVKARLEKDRFTGIRCDQCKRLKTDIEYYYMTHKKLHVCTDCWETEPLAIEEKPT